MNEIERINHRSGRHDTSRYSNDHYLVSLVIRFIILLFKPSSGHTHSVFESIKDNESAFRYIIRKTSSVYDRGPIQSLGFINLTNTMSIFLASHAWQLSILFDNTLYSLKNHSYMGLASSYIDLRNNNNNLMIINCLNMVTGGMTDWGTYLGRFLMASGSIAERMQNIQQLYHQDQLVDNESVSLFKNIAHTGLASAMNIFSSGYDKFTGGSNRRIHNIIATFEYELNELKYSAVWALQAYIGFGIFVAACYLMHVIYKRYTWVTEDAPYVEDAMSLVLEDEATLEISKNDPGVAYPLQNGNLYTVDGVIFCQINDTQDLPVPSIQEARNILNDLEPDSQHRNRNRNRTRSRSRSRSKSKHRSKPRSRSRSRPRRRSTTRVCC